MSLDIIVIIATCLILRAENIYISLLYIITTLACLRVATLCISLRYDRSASVACMRYDTIVSFWWNCIIWIAYLSGLALYYYIIMIILYLCRIDERKKYALVVELRSVLEVCQGFSLDSLPRMDENVCKVFALDSQKHTIILYYYCMFLCQ